MKMFRLLTLCVLSVSLTALPALSAGNKTLTIVHTNDLHSHLLGFSPNRDYTPDITGDDTTMGGWARIATVIKDVKKDRKNPVLVVDAGDFLMGSLFHMISREHAVEMQLLSRMGIEYSTLGNHEFDLKPRGLARILNTAYKSGSMPGIVASNIIFSKESDSDDSLEAVFKKGIVKPYAVTVKNGIKIGFFGLLGKAAHGVAPFSSPVTIEDPVTASGKMVKQLREKEKVDLVICLSHSGLWDDKSKSEDEILAEKVPGIDIIISGHTHTKVPEPIKINNTLIVQAWEYGKHVGVMDITVGEKGTELADYRIVEINDSIKGDRAVTSFINSYISIIDRTVLKNEGLAFNKTIAETGFDLTIREDESNLGNLIADSMKWYANKYVYDKKDPKSEVVFAVESYGSIRDDVLVGKTGKISVCDLFRTFPLGIGMDADGVRDDTMAYPVVTCYIYASEIKKALEIITSIYPLQGSDYFLQISGIKFTYNPKRVLFDRVTEVWIGDEGKGYKPLDYSKSNRELYRIAGNFYSTSFLKVIGSFTWDILKIVPKDRDGKAIKDLLEYRVDMDRNKPGIQEMKEWIGLMEYVKTFRDTDGDGIGEVPGLYRGKLGRIVKHASLNPVSLLSRGTWVTWTAFTVFMVLLALVIFILSRIGRALRKRRAGA